MSRGRVRCLMTVCLGGAGGVGHVLGKLKVGVVEDVEELSAELEAGPFGTRLAMVEEESPGWRSRGR